MITTDDADYLQAKRIRQGVERLDPVFDAFVAGFVDLYGVAPLSLFADTVDGRSGPVARLGVALEHSKVARRFSSSAYAFDAKKQRAVAELFVRTVPPAHSRRLFGRRLFSRPLVADDLFVVFSDFENVAKQDAHGSVTEQERRRFEKSLGLGDQFWCTQQLFGSPVVFVHTVEQARELESSDWPTAWADAYFEIVRGHDEFGYLVRGEIMIGVDSKENLDENFQGNWYYYFK